MTNYTKMYYDGGFDNLDNIKSKERIKRKSKLYNDTKKCTKCGKDIEKRIKCERKTKEINRWKDIQKYIQSDEYDDDY